METETDQRIKASVRTCMSLAGIIGNTWLFISSLPQSMSQIKTNDILFLNLAASNMISNYIVDILNIFHTEHFIRPGKVFCAIRFFLPEFSETSSILSTTFITIYWHQKLVGSLKNGGAPVQMDNLRFITVLLTCSWSFSLFFHFPHLLFVANDIGNVTAEDCVEQLPSKTAAAAYEVVYITLVNVIPLSMIIYACIQIARTLLENEQRMKNMSTEGKHEGPGSAEKKGDVSTVTKSKPQPKSGLLRAAMSVVAVAIVFIICWGIHLFIRVLGAVSPTDIIEDIESFIGASYTCIIPYIYLYGAQKLTCSCC